MIKIKKSVLALMMVGVLVVGGVVGYLLPKQNDRYSKVDTLWKVLEDRYYKEPNEKNLEEYLCKGLVAGLKDPYSQYMTKSEYDSWNAAVTGNYEGIGIVFAQDSNGNAQVISIVKDSPASKTEIRPGDYIRKVDGKAYKDTDVMASHIRGTAGTTVKIQYEHNGKLHTVKLTRETIIEETIITKQYDKIGYIQITSFEESTAKDFKAALEKCEARGDRGVIIDLRDNGGGLVTSCVDIADELMDKEVITYLEDRDGKKQYYKSEDGKTSLPFVLLVNGNSASASEILTAAVMDNTDNKVVGTKTFGKGVVQEVMPLKDGSALKLTVKQYFSPKGSVIQEKGITPDYVVKGRKAQLNKALELLK